MVTERVLIPGHRSSRSRFCFTAALLSAAVLGSADARADVSSWFYLGGGVASLSPERSGRGSPVTLQSELGMGSPPEHPVVVGGLWKTTTYFSHGTDLAFVARGASGGFVRGGFGVALDAGAYRRWWGGVGSTGFTGALVVGGLFGLQVSGFTEQGSNAVHAYGVTVGIDFLRLTVYRTTFQSYWQNPILPAHVDRSR